MPVTSAASAAYSPAIAAAATPRPDMDRDAFLQLLVTQLANQDPLSPQNGADFAAQLAQFSSVEQLTTISDSLTTHTQQLAALAAGLDASEIQQGELGDLIRQRTDLASATGLIGRTVEAAGNKLSWDGTSPPEFAYSLDEPAASVTVKVRDASGAVVREITLGHQPGGAGAGVWDGLGADGQPLPPGTYTFAVDARDGAGEPIDATTSIRGNVDRITIEADGVKLWIDGLSVPLDDLRSIVP